MRPETEVRRPPRRSAPDLAAEQEVDFGRYWSAILARWWLVGAAAVAGGIVGYLLSLGGGTLYRADATIYLGQPLSPSGNAQIQSLATNPSTVREFVKSQAVVERVAAEAGLSAGKLRSGISTQTVAGASVKQNQNPLVEISVRGPGRRQSARAANLLATAAVQNVSGYVIVKIRSLRKQLAAKTKELGEIARRIAVLNAAIDQSQKLTFVERLLLVNQVGNAEQRRGQLIDEQTETEQLLTLAQNVEASRVVTRAAPVQVAARSPRNSIVIGALIGLIVGAVLALVWAPVLGRRLRR